MTPDQIAHIRNSWALMSSATDDVATQFYKRLFEIDPSVLPLFAATDMSTQGDKLITMLTVIVRGVEDLPRLLPAVTSLGNRHAKYGVKDEQYASVGAALIWTFHAVLGSSFSKAAEESWSTAFGVLADVMIKAGHQPAQA